MILDKDFEKPTLSKVFSHIAKNPQYSPDIPKRITNLEIARRYLEGSLIFAGIPKESIDELIKKEGIKDQKGNISGCLVDLVNDCLTPEDKKVSEDIKNLDTGQIFALTKRYKINNESIKKVIKTGGGAHIIRIDSVKVIDAFLDYASRIRSMNIDAEKFKEMYRRSYRLTNTFVESLKLWPSSLIRQAMFLISPEEKAPIGYAHRGADNRLRVYMYSEIFSGMRLDAAYEKGIYNLDFGEHLWGKNLSGGAESLSKTERENQSVSITQLPYFKKDDPKQYSYGFRILYYCSCKQQEFQSLMHDKQAWDLIIPCQHDVAFFIKALRELKETTSNKRKIRINPFSLFRETTAEYADKLLSRGFIIDEKGNRSIVNDFEFSKQIGLYIKNNKRYSNKMFFYMANRDFTKYIIN